jgi:hypothetical protein
MPSQLRPILIHPFFLIVGTLLLARSAWAAPKYKVLHAFGSGNDGAGLWAIWRSTRRAMYSAQPVGAEPMGTVWSLS